MGDRTWYPNGVSSTPVEGLTEDSLKSFETLLKDKGFSRSKIEAFLAELDNAQGTYFSARDLQKRAAPSAVRDNLQKLHTSSTKLLSQLDPLDLVSMSLIEEALDGSFDQFRKQVLDVANTIERARSYAQSYPKSGRLTDYPLHLMALRVRYGIEKHLEEKATASWPSRHGALFNEILSMMVFAIRQTEANESGKSLDKDWQPSVHKVALRALKGTIIDTDDDMPPRFIVYRDDND